MDVLWTMLASQDRADIREYIAEHNLRAAIELDKRIGVVASSLSDHPARGRTGRVGGTNELIIHPHYVLVYRIVHESDRVEIIRVLHSSQKWP